MLRQILTQKAWRKKNTHDRKTTRNITKQNNIIRKKATIRKKHYQDFDILFPDNIPQKYLTKLLLKLFL